MGVAKKKENLFGCESELKKFEQNINIHPF